VCWGTLTEPRHVLDLQYIVAVIRALVSISGWNLNKVSKRNRKHLRGRILESVIIRCVLIPSSTEDTPSHAPSLACYLIPRLFGCVDDKVMYVFNMCAKVSGTVRNVRRPSLGEGLENPPSQTRWRTRPRLLREVISATSKKSS
jgi:hypothetical protein